MYKILPQHYENAKKLGVDIAKIKIWQDTILNQSCGRLMFKF